MYIIFYWVHVVSYIVWVLAFLGSLYKYFQISNSADSVSKKQHILAERKITSIGGHFGALGILISGGAMASIPGGPKWGWFDFANYSWLATKQVIFLVLLVVLVFAMINSVRFKKIRRTTEGDQLTEKALSQYKKAYNYSAAVYVMVVINTILGLFKPF